MGVPLRATSRRFDARQNLHRRQPAAGHQCERQQHRQRRPPIASRVPRFVRVAVLRTAPGDQRDQSRQQCRVVRHLRIAASDHHRQHDAQSECQPNAPLARHPIGQLDRPRQPGGANQEHDVANLKQHRPAQRIAIRRQPCGERARSQSPREPIARHRRQHDVGDDIQVVAQRDSSGSGKISLPG